MRGGADLDNADNRALPLRMVEEPQIANRHLAHEVARLIVAHAVPFLARVPLGDLVRPAPGRGFGFEQPVGHYPITRFHGISCTSANNPALA